METWNARHLNTPPNLPEPAPSAGSRLQLEPFAEPIPGYRLISPLGSGGFGEVWKCEAPGGAPRAIKFILGKRHVPAEAHLEPPLLWLVKAIRHPFLMSPERIEIVNGDLVIVTELADKNLYDAFQECQAQGLPGVPRDWLLALLAEAAEALEYLNGQHDLPHLDVKPKNLLLIGSHVKVTDFGLVPPHPERKSPHEGKDGPLLAHINLRYAAPELFRQQVGRTADQYSLALIYCEMLTGVHPLHGQPRPRGPGEPFRCKPDLRLLSDGDREAVSRALNVDPRRRHASCKDLIRALQEGVTTPTGEPIRPRERKTSLWPPVIRWPITPGPVAAVPDLTLDEVVLELMSVAGTGALGHQEHLHCVLLPGDLLEHRCTARLPSGVARLRLGGFIDQWRAELLQEFNDQFVLRVPLPGPFRQPRPGLEVQIRLLPQRRPAAMSEVNITMRPVGCGRDQAVQVLREKGPAVLESLRNFLQAYPEQRRGQRLSWEPEVCVCQTPHDLQTPRVIEGQGKDISRTGLSFFLPGAPTSRHVYVHLATPEAESLALLARVIRLRPLGDGWYEVGARFESHAPPAEKAK